MDEIFQAINYNTACVAGIAGIEGVNPTCQLNGGLSFGLMQEWMANPMFLAAVGLFIGVPLALFMLHYFVGIFARIVERL